MNSVFEYLCLRKPRLDYISPPICCDFSGSGFPVIVLDPFGRLVAPTGLILGGDGNLTLSWDPYFGALCFNIYQAVDENNPDGEYVIIAECVEGNSFQLPEPGSYRVSVITPEGESELSPPITATGGVGPPVPCPPETGTDTPCDLGTDVDIDLGTRSIAPTHYDDVQVNSWGTVDAGNYAVSYGGGAYKFDGNPDPGDFRIQGYHIRWTDSSTDYFDQFGTCNEPSEAQVEACVPVGAEITHITGGGTISLEFDNGGGPELYSGGTTPQFSLHQTKSYPSFPDRVRIKNYHANFFSLGGTCLTAFDSTDPTWDGTFPTKSISPPTAFTWRNLDTLSLQGKLVFDLRVTFAQNHPTNSTGCGWRIDIIVDGPSNSIAWRGFKGVGTTPVGRYYRATTNPGCSAGPDCLEIESY